MDGLFWNKQGLLVAVFLSTVGSCGAFVSAAPIELESATLGPSIAGGQTIGATQFIGWRFSIDVPLAVNKVGGNLAGADGNNIFAAIVPLDDLDSFPQEGAFSAPDAIGVKTDTLPLPSEDVRYPLLAIIEPGSYALVFGTGEFDATGTGAIVNSSLQEHIDPTTAASFIIGKRSQSTDPLVWQVGPTANMRFVVQGALLAGTADFDLSGRIDGDDLTVWETHFGTASNATIPTGNADDDDDTDGVDLLVWQQQFGIGTTTVRAITAVPEPATGWLLLTVWSLAPFGRSRSRSLAMIGCS